VLARTPVGRAPARCPDVATISGASVPAHGHDRTIEIMSLRPVPVARFSAKLVLTAVPMVLLFRMLVGIWTSVEAAAAGSVAATVGSTEFVRSGHQLLVTGDKGVFVLIVSGWCSSLGAVLAVTAVAFAARGDRRRRARSAVAASAMLVLGNVGRVAAVVIVGADVDPARVEPFHDGPATAFTVALVLAAALVVAWSTRPLDAARVSDDVPVGAATRSASIRR
jgi:exosortase/archaeosortase family protein